VWGLVTHGALALWVASASAESPAVHVQLAAAACPSPSELEDKLEPLLDAELDISESDAPIDAEVIDHGEGFTIEVAGVEREFSDRARDCVERARQAAVFIALNLKPSAAEESGERHVTTALRVGLQLSAELAYTRTQNSLAPGPGAGIWLDYGSLRFVFSAAILFANEISVQSADVAGAVRLTRIPLALAASYLFHLGRFAIGPELGLGLDVLHFHGRGLERVQTQLRTNLGLVAAIDAQLQLSDALSALVRVGLNGFPRAYTLSIDPVGPAGRTPKLWLTASLGVSWRFGG
jgi:hypothetical protein